MNFLILLDSKLFRKMNEQLMNELAALDGALIECGCCCADVAIENSVQCSEGHLFCRTCLQVKCTVLSLNSKHMDTIS